ncbi:hypothetical protein KGF56_003090 [Candida oxycetoniae]|uniref:Uncharacterized protein n=1 Tax=Candida oxycetoniae TaxID=497107 RepID=A0AAI9SWI3_9ASCO|nr:uncharacterized protein KGF56_003090 [Candida oxycetoniae]KAI3404054.1 hypothetical protein KGF56_003090 [Candida oxycetoniae]
MLSLKLVSLLLVAANSFVRGETEDTTSYDGTTVITTTPSVVATTTIPAVVDVYGDVYIWTNEAGALTSTTLYVTVTREIDATATPAEPSTNDSSASEPTEEPSASANASSGSSQQVPQVTSAVPATTATSTAPLSTTFATPPSSSSSSDVSAVAPNRTTISTDIPDGDYATKTVTTDTILSDGSTAVLELVVLYTAVCNA